MNTQEWRHKPRFWGFLYCNTEVPYKDGKWQERLQSSFSYLWSWDLISRSVQNPAPLPLNRDCSSEKVASSHWNSGIKGLCWMHLNTTNRYEFPEELLSSYLTVQEQLKTPSLSLWDFFFLVLHWLFFQESGNNFENMGRSQYQISDNSTKTVLISNYSFSFGHSPFPESLFCWSGFLPFLASSFVPLLSRAVFQHHHPGPSFQLPYWKTIIQIEIPLHIKVENI